ITAAKQPLPADDDQTGAVEPGADRSPEASQQASSEPPSRAGWNSKVEYFLAQVGFSVGLGNVWRFPYLCHQNGGGAFLLLYVLLMLVVGIPLFFLELAAGQDIRQGSIGVWKYISPKLAGIGYSSCVVCFFVALYYNVILAWSLFYLGNSFQSPLPWQQCPEQGNITERECEESSPTSYFWYRRALNITDSIDEVGSFNPYIVGCLLAAWIIVCLGMFKGIKSSVKVGDLQNPIIQVRNVKELLQLHQDGHVNSSLMPTFNHSDPDSLGLDGYRSWFNQHGGSVPVNLTACDLEKEMQTGVEGTGLAFIAFTEAMTLLPGSPFWSALFFLMLLNLGLSTMFGTMEGILAPLRDRFRSLAKHKTKLTVVSCLVGFLIGLLFTQRCGNYFVTMFDDYSATLPLIIVVVFETFSVSWLYGADRFLDDIEAMLGWRPSVIYKYLWKYVCLLAMLGLLAATTIRMFMETPTYMSWNQETASEVHLPYPGWALAVLALLIVFAMLPVPVGFIYSVLQDRRKPTHRDTETGHYSIVNTDETPMTDLSVPDRRNGFTAAEHFLINSLHTGSKTFL
uniref:Transporter n=1 Tax=Fundulus heteroclitus TaxID=8078 RepID=A0A3Q2Q360_FUNHE